MPEIPKHQKRILGDTSGQLKPPVYLWQIVGRFCCYLLPYCPDKMVELSQQEVKTDQMCHPALSMRSPLTLILLDPRLRNLRLPRPLNASMGIESKKLKERSSSTRLANSEIV